MACVAQTPDVRTTPSDGTPAATQPTKPIAQPPSASEPTAVPTVRPDTARLVNSQVGYSLEYPGEWRVRGQVVASEFAEGATCESVQIIDFEPPQGMVGAMLHAFVQICSRPVQDSLTLDEFMQRTYGEALASTFESVKFAGSSAYRTKQEGPNATTYLQTKAHRIQLISAVAADEELENLRSAQVAAILETFALGR